MLLRHQEEEISKSFPSTEIRRLQEQNTSLRDAVAQMRTEMEALSGHALPSAQLGGEIVGTQQPDTKAAAAATTPGEWAWRAQQGRVRLRGVQSRCPLESCMCTSLS